ncbi:MAG: histidinol-phosphate transaminase [Methanotrichaceae archaeon]
MEKYYKNLRPCLNKIKPYVAGKGINEIAAKYGIRPEDIVKLGSNENPYGPSPKVGICMREFRPEIYPEPENLIKVLATYTGLPVEQIVIGSGMDGVMDTLTRLFLDPGDKALIYTPTFSYYEILTRLCGAEPVFISRDPNFDVPIEIPENIKFVFLCSPNNPTGNMIPENDLRNLVENTEAIVFLDEAYAEFSEQNFLNLVCEYENLIVGRTMSKAFGLAGMRLGYALVPEWIAYQYRKVTPPFSVTVPSIAAGVAALEDLDYMKNVISEIKRERERLLKEVPSAYPSGGNFLYVETKEPSKIVAEELLKRGIIIRDCASFRGAGDHYVRVTIGTPEQNDKFIRAYREITC